MANRPIFKGILSRHVAFSQGRRQVEWVCPKYFSTHLSQDKSAKNMNCLVFVYQFIQANIQDYSVWYPLVDVIPKGVSASAFPKLRQ